eukprot:TRINITY_DN61112_c0_g1_i1.p1 TRINITY_DN61112_c0_g1~~TRINITY_DN61112_c0_g1_i1.p1  ORF type:complete len:200 (+),score=24.68 TRINITY_DN61112_c0_g1_i1:421-1020(+)
MLTQRGEAVLLALGALLLWALGASLALGFGALFSAGAWRAYRSHREYKAKHSRPAEESELAEEEFHRAPLWDGYVSHEQLAGWLRQGQSVAVIDVRDFDFGRMGCKIAGARHEPLTQFLSAPESLGSVLKAQSTVVFHCMFSQYRGPASAQEYARYCQRTQEADERQRVLVLRGGFAKFFDVFKDASDKHILFEDLEQT